MLFRLPTSATIAPLSLRERLRPITYRRVVLALFPAFLWNVGVYVIYPYVALLLQRQLHISDVSILLACFGLGIVLANCMSGRLSDRFGANLLVLVFLVALIVIQLVLPLVMTTISSGAIMLLLWGMSFALLFIPQQKRLLIIAPEHATVLLALNNSALYLGIAGGAAVGGLALRWLTVSQLAWVGVMSMLIALLIVSSTLLLGGLCSRWSAEARKKNVKRWVRTEPTGVEPCLSGTFRTSGEQDGASHRKNVCQIEVGMNSR